jgi:sulfite reductase (NADPH) hemoprotein beta-component
MYRYDHFDHSLVQERVREFRDQVRRRLAGELSEDEFKPLRLRNGLYLQRHAYMLRVAIPYGLFSSRQLRALAGIARRYDRGFAHFTTRQNIQFNWPQLEAVPDILEELAAVEMHAIQTSGNCIRNITSDHLAGVAADELEDPRPWCEILRQWSTLHPEFYWLPRKFKIAVTGAARDRTALRFHDIGLRLVHNADGVTGFEVWVGGGLGRAPAIAERLRDFLPGTQLLSYVEAILRVYNLHGRRDNLHKARIKVLVQAMGVDRLREQVEAAWQAMDHAALALDPAELAAMQRHFTPVSPARRPLPVGPPPDPRAHPGFAHWLRQNTRAHKDADRRIVYVSLKHPGAPPGDITAAQMEAVADLADRYSHGELRASHEQNLVLAHVANRDLVPLWRALDAQGLATANIGTVQDMICCPGIDFCALANAASIPVARGINQRFEHLDELYRLGEVRIKISGCMNACGHHHVGDIGILGVDKHGEQWYQVTLGGSASDGSRIGTRLGPALPAGAVADAVAAVLEVFAEQRSGEESFASVFRRLGVKPFKELVYAPHHETLDTPQPVAACS